MKKIIALIFAVLCVSSVNVFATAPVRTEAVADKAEQTHLSSAAVISFEEDFSGLTYNGEYFTMFNANSFEIEWDGGLEYTLSLTDAQAENVAAVSFSANSERSIIDANYSFKNGTTLYATYIKHEFISEFDRVVGDDWKSGEIDFEYPYDNQLSVDLEELLGKQINLFTEDVDWPVFMVYATSKEAGLKTVKGCVVEDENEYYYIDFAKAQITYSEPFSIFDYANVLAYKITDEALCEQIDDAIQRNYGDNYGFLDDDEFTDTVADVILILVFGVIPFAVFILFFILAIRSKTYYKKFFRAIYISAIVVFAIFISLTILL